MTNFAAVEARMATACMRLANATAIVGAESVSGVFNRQTLVINGVEGTYPTFTLQTSEVAAKSIRQGTQLRIPVATQTNWGSQEIWRGEFIVRGLEPDGAGITMLVLEAV